VKSFLVELLSGGPNGGGPLALSFLGKS